MRARRVDRCFLERTESKQAVILKKLQRRDQDRLRESKRRNKYVGRKRRIRPRSNRGTANETEEPVNHDDEDEEVQLTRRSIRRRYDRGGHQRRRTKRPHGSPSRRHHQS